MPDNSNLRKFMLALPRLLVPLPLSDVITCDELAWRATLANVERPFCTIGYADNQVPRPRSGAPMVESLDLFSQYRGAPYAPDWDPSMLALEERSPSFKLWAGFGHRQRDMQKWVDAKKLVIFDSENIRCTHVAPGALIRMEAAATYLTESGFVVCSEAELQGAAECLEPRSDLQQIRDGMQSPELDAPPAPSAEGEPSDRPAVKKGTRWLRPSEVMARLGKMPESTFYLRKKNDPNFPRAYEQGPNTVVYDEEDVDRYSATFPPRKPQSKAKGR